MLSKYQKQEVVEVLKTEITHLITLLGQPQMGYGASSVILLAECISCQEKHHLAVKVVKKTAKCPTASLCAERELLANSKIVDHGNVVRMCSSVFIHCPGLKYNLRAGLVIGKGIQHKAQEVVAMLAFECVQGGNLLTYVQKGGSFPEN